MADVLEHKVKGPASSDRTCRLLNLSLWVRRVWSLVSRHWIHVCMIVMDLWGYSLHTAGYGSRLMFNCGKCWFKVDDLSVPKLKSMCTINEKTALGIGITILAPSRFSQRHQNIAKVKYALS